MRELSVRDRKFLWCKMPLDDSVFNSDEERDKVSTLTDSTESAIFCSGKISKGCMLCIISEPRVCIKAEFDILFESVYN